MTPSYKLFYYPGTASLAPHVLLEEIGCKFELVLVDREVQAHKSAEYLKLNPAGLIPAFIDGDTVLTETVAIMLHLADSHPDANLIPPLRTHERAHCYRWLIYMTNTLQAMLIHYFYPDRIGGEHADAIKANATNLIMPMIDILEKQLASSGGPYLLGKQYSIADIFLFMMCRWTRGMPNPARNRPHLATFLAMMMERPAVKRVFAKEGISQPWY